MISNLLTASCQLFLKTFETDDDSRIAEKEVSPTQSEFIAELFSKLEQCRVRYCVLHSWEVLPTRVTSDIDIAVHPEDIRKLIRAFEMLASGGYVAVQSLNYFVNAYYVVFSWSRGVCPEFLALDVIFEHRRGGLVVPTGDALVANRRKYKNLWIPDQSAEFAYLLSKKAWKRSISANQVQRLQYLAAKLGTINAREIAGQLFLRNVACKVVESTAAGNLDCMIHALGWETWHKSFRQQPCRAARYLFEDILRRIKRWMRPTGLFVVIVGPDGIGKSTMIASVLKTVSPCFRRRASFHWRPGWIRFNRREVISRGPHDLPPRGRMSSIFAILIYFADYWLGYIMGIRVMLARSGLVLFDRYFYDISIDPLRFRIKGCRWLVRLLERMVPQPDLVIVLDASETTVHQRKQELTLEEIRRQRQAYRQLARRSRVPTIISASGDIKATTKAVSDEILRFLAGRLQNRTVFASKRMFND